MMFYFGWLIGTLRAVPMPDSPIVPVYRDDIGAVVAMDLEEYVKGVVAAEMPVSFHLEALKAQAVAARTYALQLVRDGQYLRDHPEALISTNPNVHQAWVSREDLKKRWGTAYLVRWAKITRAATATRGMVLVFDGELIFPAYHSSSGGRTEDSEKYWTGVVPYLRSVDDPYIAGSRYEETEAIIDTPQLVETVLGPLQPSLDGSSPVVEVISRYPSGRVESVRVGEQLLTGRKLRETLGLRSNWFHVESEGNATVFRVKGYGHGVGMSQYGADGMGRAGFTFDRILTHYYTGIEVVSWYE